MADAKSFSAQVDAWARKAEGRVEAVFKTAAQKTFEEAQTPVAQGGKMPVDFGFLRNSFSASLDQMPSGPETKKEGEGNPGSVDLTISNAKLGDTIYAGWTAKYALRQEHGFQGEDSLGRKYDQKGYGFMESAAQNWPKNVRTATAEAKAKIR